MTLLLQYTLFRKCFLLLILIPALTLILACNGGNHPSAADGQVNPGDSTKLAATDGTEKATMGFDRYQERAHVDLKKYVVSIQSGYYKADSLREPGTIYPERNLLMVRNKLTNKADTVLLETSDQLNEVRIKDLTDSLHFEKLFLQIEWVGDSDVPWSEFAGYQQDSLKSFFTLTMVESLRRADQWTLTGFTGGRDELVANFQRDYPVTVYLKDFSVVENRFPAVQYIGYSSSATEPIKGYKMTSLTDSIPYTIKKEQAVLVDTLYRVTGKVRLVVSDSIIIHTTVKELKGKLIENTAG